MNMWPTFFAHVKMFNKFVIGMAFQYLEGLIILESKRFHYIVRLFTKYLSKNRRNVTEAQKFKIEK